MVALVPNISFLVSDPVRFQNDPKFIRESDPSMVLSCLPRIMAQVLTSPNCVGVTRFQRSTAILFPFLGLRQAAMKRSFAARPESLFI